MQAMYAALLGTNAGLLALLGTTLIVFGIVLLILVDAPRRAMRALSGVVARWQPWRKEAVQPSDELSHADLWNTPTKREAVTPPAEHETLTFPQRELVTSPPQHETVTTPAQREKVTSPPQGLWLTTATEPTAGDARRAEESPWR